MASMNGYVRPDGLLQVCPENPGLLASFSLLLFVALLFVCFFTCYCSHRRVSSSTPLTALCGTAAYPSLRSTMLDMLFTYSALQCLTTAGRAVLRTQGVPPFAVAFFSSLAHLQGEVWYPPMSCIYGVFMGPWIRYITAGVLVVAFLVSSAGVWALGGTGPFPWLLAVTTFLYQLAYPTITNAVTPQLQCVSLGLGYSVLATNPYVSCDSPEQDGAASGAMLTLIFYSILCPLAMAVVVGGATGLLPSWVNVCGEQEEEDEEEEEEVEDGEGDREGEDEEQASRGGVTRKQEGTEGSDVLEVVVVNPLSGSEKTTTTSSSSSKHHGVITSLKPSKRTSPSTSPSHVVATRNPLRTIRDGDEGSRGPLAHLSPQQQQQQLEQQRRKHPLDPPWHLWGSLWGFVPALYWLQCLDTALLLILSWGLTLPGQPLILPPSFAPLINPKPTPTPTNPLFSAYMLASAIAMALASFLHTRLLHAFPTQHAARRHFVACTYALAALTCVGAALGDSVSQGGNRAAADAALWITVVVFALLLLWATLHLFASGAWLRETTLLPDFSGKDKRTPVTSTPDATPPKEVKNVMRLEREREVVVVGDEEEEARRKELAKEVEQAEVAAAAAAVASEAASEAKEQEERVIKEKELEEEERERLEREAKAKEEEEAVAAAVTAVAEEEELKRKEAEREVERLEEEKRPQAAAEEAEGAIIKAAAEAAAAAAAALQKEEEEEKERARVSLEVERIEELERQKRAQEEERVRKEREEAAAALAERAVAAEVVVVPTAARGAAGAVAPAVQVEKATPPSLVGGSTTTNGTPSTGPVDPLSYTLDKVVSPASQKWRSAIHSVKGTWRGLTALSTGNAPLRPGTLTAPAAAPAGASTSSSASPSKPTESLAELLAKAKLLNTSAGVVAAFKLGVGRGKRVKLTEREAALLILAALRKHKQRRLKSGIAALLSPRTLKLTEDFFKPQKRK